MNVVRKSTDDDSAIGYPGSRSGDTQDQKYLKLYISRPSDRQCSLFRDFAFTRTVSEAHQDCTFQFCRYNMCMCVLHDGNSVCGQRDGNMKVVSVSRADFLNDAQGKTFADVVNDPEQPFDTVLEFFDDADRQRRMEESELHHDRSPLAGVVRELESTPAIDRFLTGVHARRTTRLRQAIGVLVRIIMEGRGWQKTGRKGSLGVRAAKSAQTAAHNTGGLAFWFVRTERYERSSGMPFQSVRQRCEEFESRNRKQASVK